VFDRNATRLAHFAGSTIAGERELENLSRFDLIVEATGDVESLERILAGAKAGGSLLLLGFPYGERPFNFERIVGYDLNVVGSVGSTARDFEEAIRTISTIDLRAFFEAILPLSDFERAWDLARSRKHLKVVFRVDDSLSDAMTAAQPNAVGVLATTVGT
jgi:threonine dehydrogenase-like Zn-dependent dehydrogenase